MRDLTIKLSGKCTKLTSCIYANSNNTVAGNRNEEFPENIYVWNCSVSNVTLIGTYSLSWQDNYQYLSDEALNYRGVGIMNNHLYFNFFDCDGLICKHLYAGVYSGGGSNNFRIFVTESRHAVYDDSGGGNNRFEIKGHTYYGYGPEGIISATDYVAYTSAETSIFDIMGFYDTQHTKACIYFTGLSMDNICYLIAPATALTTGESPTFKGHAEYIDFGRSNEIQPFKRKLLTGGNK